MNREAFDGGFLSMKAIDTVGLNIINRSVGSFLVVVEESEPSYVGFRGKPDRIRVA
jgi:hypothetical protein